ncbi:MerR family transcriptional regulator [Fulvimarina sp. MAC3]|uniref:MerR family transcriptional regulator n=1 Tax=Fulvimarina sp. MAC3 TaxID=3148887 RepID=UPI0031FBFEF1
MRNREYTIGTLSRLTGTSVRKLRFYSDAGLIPPARRTDSGYRLYTETDVARLHLISALREAGVGLHQIREIISERQSLADVLNLRVKALEIEIASRRRMAALLQATLKREALESDLTELWSAMRLSRQQFERAIERFYRRAIQGAQSPGHWAERMADTASVELPADPTPEQVSAWSEITAMISESKATNSMREDYKFVWNESLNPEAYWAAAENTFAEIQRALDEGIGPTSREGVAIAETWIARSACAMSRNPDDVLIRWYLEQHKKYGERREKYERLREILVGRKSSQSPGASWNWINEALSQLLVSRGRKPE